MSLLINVFTCFNQAPEVANAEPYGHAADWWSLGILMYALLTGQVCYLYAIYMLRMPLCIADGQSHVARIQPCFAMPRCRPTVAYTVHCTALY